MLSIREELIQVRNKIKEAKKLESEKEHKEAAKKALEAAEILTNIAKKKNISGKLKEQLCDRAEKLLTWARILKDTTALKESSRERQVKKVETIPCEPRIKSIYLIYDDGTPIYFRIFNNITSDPLLVSGALSGISTLIKEITQAKSDLKKIDYGEGEILFERGEKITMAVFTTLSTEEMRNRIAKIVKKIETHYKNILENWDGDLSKFGGLQKDIDELLETQ